MRCLRRCDLEREHYAGGGGGSVGQIGHYGRALSRHQAGVSRADDGLPVGRRGAGRTRRIKGALAGYPEMPNNVPTCVAPPSAAGVQAVAVVVTVLAG
jgi:hypothetical protein